MWRAFARHYFSMRFIRIHIILLVLISCLYAVGQGNANIWNWNNGIQFRFEKDALVSDTFSVAPYISSAEGNVFMGSEASYTDEKDSLILYTREATVYRENGDVLINGDNIGPKALKNLYYSHNKKIIIKNKNENKFHVIQGSVYRDLIELITREAFTHSIVDLTSYPGEITKKSTFLTQDRLASGGRGIVSMAAYSHPSGEFTWLAIVQPRNFNTGQLMLYKVSDDTVELVRTQLLVDVWFRESGHIKFSNYGNFLAFTGLFRQGSTAFGRAVLVYEFDASSGELGDYRMLNTLSQPNYNLRISQFRSMEFSPNERYIYVSGLRNEVTDSTYILQCTNPFIDQNDSLFRTVDASAQLNYITGLQLAPNGRIYVPSTDPSESFVSCIREPNNRAPYSSFVRKDVRINRSMWAKGMPYFVQDYICPRVIESDTLCLGEETTIALINDFSDSVFFFYRDDILSFNTSDTVTYTFADTGTHTYGIVYHYPAFVDTLYAKAHVRSLPDYSLPEDTLLCNNEELDIRISLDNDEAVAWVDGSLSATRTISTEGEYSVTISDEYCEMTDTLSVYYVDCNVDVEGLCYGDSTYFTWATTQIDSVSISLEDLDTILTAKYFSKIFIEPGTKSLDYSVYKQGFSKAKVLNFEIIEMPEEYLRDSLRSCVYENIVPSIDVSLYSNRWLWESSQRSSGRADSTGWYTLILSKDLCEARDSTYFIFEECFCDVYVPDGFSPNNDGLNDVFRPTTECDIRDVKMSIYSRWGQKLIDSEKVEWDGTFLGEECQVGAYLWTLSYTSPDGERFNLKGVISLLR